MSVGYFTVTMGIDLETPEDEARFHSTEFKRGLREHLRLAAEMYINASGKGSMAKVLKEIMLVAAAKSATIDAFTEAIDHTAEGEKSV